MKLASSNSTLLFLGDNIYQKGLPPEDDPSYASAQNKLKMQLKITNDFKGKTVFIPGNHDWYNGLKGLERQQLMVTDYLGDKKSFLPRKGCGLDILDINDNLTLITIDSEWFIQNWDKHPGINDQCDIKTRDALKSYVV